MDKHVKILLVDETSDLRGSLTVEAKKHGFDLEIQHAVDMQTFTQILTLEHPDFIACTHSNSALDYGSVIKLLFDQKCMVPVFVIAEQCSSSMIAEALRTGALYCLDINNLELMFACIDRERIRTEMSAHTGFHHRSRRRYG